MKTCAALALSLTLLLSPVVALAAEEQKPAPRDDRGQGLEELGRDFRSWLGRWWEYFGGTTAHEQQPVISLLLRNREKVGLSDDQVKKLEQLRSDFEKETIRNEADIRVAEIDLNNLLQAPMMVPEEFTGDIMGDLQKRRGIPEGIDTVGTTRQLVKAKVPFAEVTHYATDLRSMTGGQGAFSWGFSHYQEVPHDLAQKIIDAAQAEKEAAH